MARYTGHTATFGIVGQTVVTQILSISGPGISRDTIDSTDADAANDWRTFVASYVDGGEVTIELNFDPDDATQKDAANGLLYGFNPSGDPRTYRVTFPDTSPATWSFTGILTGFEPNNPHDGMSTVSATIKVSGEITFA